jgi:uncharacterized membrane protein YbhN (UPF0104 family)
MDKQKLWGILKTPVKIAVTAGMLYLVFRKIDFNDVKTIFLKSNPFYIALSIIFYFAAQTVTSLRMLIFLKSIGINIKKGFSFRLYLLGAFYNLFLPGGIGGDGYKIYLLRKKFNRPTKRIFWALFLERLSGVWAIGLIAVTLILFIPQIDVHPLWPIIALLSGTLIYYIILKKFFKDYSRYFFTTHFLSGIVQSLSLISVICLLLSQNFHGKFSPYLFSFLASTVISVIPLGIGGLGIRDYAMINAVTLFGMDNRIAVFLTTTFWMVSIFASLPGAWFAYHSQEFYPVPKTVEAKEFEKKADESLDSTD